ncbi:nectin-2 isoform X2 [Artibeus jamaicensis]|uniref:nectin-2 isoform X2 n=1 Tax=Artibeus jamaicensis TaxID=9417 RepID=UPI00235B1709|nr:nectin-2 isoform X2 [Artibeus jamaicensis]
MARAAALPPSRSSPTLRLLPLLLPLLLGKAGAQDGQVQMPPEVRGLLGDTVKLPCHLLSQGPRVNVSQVTWQRLDPAGKTQSVAAFHPSHGLSFPSPQFSRERLSFLAMGSGPAAQPGSEMQDATLVLQGLRVEDEGNYSCEFATFPQGTSRGVTWLRAIAKPQNQVDAQEVTVGSQPVPVARCVSSGGRPPARISWFSPLNGEARETEVAGPVFGTVTVTSRYTLVPSSQADGVKVTCKVEHETFKEPDLLPVTLSVRYPPEVTISGYDDNWYLGRSDVTLNCDAHSNPEPTDYVWSTTSGDLPASAKGQGSQLIVYSVDRLVNTTFICTVSNALGTGRAEQVVLVRDTPRASPQDEGPMVWGAVGGTLLVLLLLAGGSLAFILLRMRRRRKSPGGGGGAGGTAGEGREGRDSGRGSYNPKTQVFENGGPVFWTTTPGPLTPDGKDAEEGYEEEEEKAEKGLMLPPSPALEDDMESQLDGSLISRRAVYV